MIRLAIAFAFVSVMTIPVRADDANAESAVPRFETHVRSILKKHCFHCHGEEEELSGGLDLRLVRFMHKGGESGSVIVAGNPDESVLLQMLRDGQMPPDESKLLTPAEIGTIRRWIESGAQTVRPEPTTIDASTFITEEEKTHWSFQPVKKPNVPTVNMADAVASPIDAFLLSQLTESGFGFSPSADPKTLIRRLYLDLHGLPPEPADVDAFVTEYDDATWSKTVDALLNDQHYGERWARHWLDIAGYADSEGYNDVDAERPHAWRYRDYVIRSLNADKPFDRFVTEQLAGDELISSPLNNLTDSDAEFLAATGFLRMAPDGTGGAVPDKNQARNDTIADTIRIVSSSLMGMTVGCAQCHDHRYDPISQADYYQFRAIFEPALDWKKWKTPAQRLVSLYTDEDRAAAAKVENEAKKIDVDHAQKQAAAISKTFEKQLATLPQAIHELARTAHKTSAKKRSPEQKSLIKKYPKLNVTASSLYLYDKKAADSLKSIAAKAKKLRATKPKQESVRAAMEASGKVPVTNLFFRGNFDQPKQAVLPAGLTVISSVNHSLESIPANADEISTTGRRLALAKRLTNPQHPLTARVIVNRIWRHHFGRGLVETPSDFGVLGQKPSHPKLLDWLAAELIDSGWSLKQIHRLILTSNAWRQQLRTNEDLMDRDPDNVLYGGMRLRRLDAEVVRDCMLAVSGKLNGKAFGPAVPVMADSVGRFVVGKENLNAGRPGAVIDMKGEQFRRSIYVQVRRSRPLSVLQAFDRPAMTPNCDMRRPSTSSTQSLLMMNSDLLQDYSRAMADRVLAEGPVATPTEGLATPIELSGVQQIQRAWQLAYSRSATESEIQTAVAFLADQTKVFAQQAAYKPIAISKTKANPRTKSKAKTEKPPARTAEQEAFAVLCQMLLSSSEFLYAD